MATTADKAYDAYTLERLHGFLGELNGLSRGVITCAFTAEFANGKFKVRWNDDLGEYEVVL